jgi:arylsulfatase A-like enzyme
MNTYLRSFFGVVLALFLWSCSPETKSPNILFIAVDDLRPELGCYGNDLMHTPNMDKLAGEGLLFNNHYVQVPTCGASRHALLTGRRPSKKIHLSNNAIVKEISEKQNPANPETFIEALKDNGYHTVGIGKISHSADGLVYGYTDPVSEQKELPNSWSELLYNSGKWKTGWNAFFGYADGENRQSMKRQVKPYEAGDVEDAGYPDGLSTELAIDKIRELRDQDQPFFMGLGYFKPHLPFNAPKKYWDLYDRNQIEVSASDSIPLNTLKKYLHNSGELNGYQLTDEKVSLDNPASLAYAKKLRHAYYASVSYIDAQIGRVLKELKSAGLDQNTIVVVWGDHGWNLGDHRVWGKHTLQNRSLKSALIVKVPQSKSNLHNTNSVVETVDIYPTLLELCGIAIDHRIDGESFTDLLEDPELEKEDVAYSYFKGGLSVKTNRYRLTKYVEAPPVYYLFDHQKDPDENTNIAPSNPEIVEKLTPLLDAGDTGIYKE